MKAKSLIIYTISISLFLIYSFANDIGICPAVAINGDALFDVCPYAEAGSFEVFYIDTTDQANPNAQYYFQVSIVVPQAVNCSNPANTPGYQVYATVSYQPTIEQLLQPGGATICHNIAIGDPDIEAIDSDDESQGLQFVFPNNTSSAFGRQLFIQLTCNSSATDVGLTNFTVTTFNSSTVVMAAPSSSGCPTISLSRLVSFFHKYKYIFLGLFFILGVFICFFGFHVLKAAIFTIAAVGGALISASLFFEFTSMGTPKWALWVIFAICIILGLILGYFAVQVEIIGFIALGVVLGGVTGLFIYNLALAPFLKGRKAVFYWVVVLFGVIGGLISYKLWKQIIIIATSVIGSYMMVRSVSVLIGGFPSEDSIASGVGHFSGWTYLYLLVMALLATGGGYLQWRKQKEKDFEKGSFNYEAVV